LLPPFGLGPARRGDGPSETAARRGRARRAEKAAVPGAGKKSFSSRALRGSLFQPGRGTAAQLMNQSRW